MSISRRYLIIGCSGSGKSTLAKNISRRCGVPFINTDALYWTEDWTVVSDKEVIAAIDLDAAAYVLDGNFVASRETVWRKVDVIIWLNFGRAVILRRLFFRNMGWWISGTSPWTGTRMSFRRAWSGLLHGYRSHAKKRKTYPGYLAQYTEKEIHIVSSSREAEELLGRLCGQVRRELPGRKADR